MLHDSTIIAVVVAVVRTRPRAIPLPMITMRKSIHRFLFPYMVMGLCFCRRSAIKCLYHRTTFTCDVKTVHHFSQMYIFDCLACSVDK